MFIQSAFIRKNSPYLQEKLKEMGYKTDSISVNTGCIATSSTHDSFTVIAESRFDSTNPHVTWNNGNRIDCGDNEELFLAIAALRDDTDYMQWFMIPHTKTVPIPGYCGQQGMNGYQRIITSVEYHKYDKKDSRVSDLIKFEKEDGETILPRKLNIDELKLWFNHKIMHNPYKDNPNIKYYVNNIRE